MKKHVRKYTPKRVKRYVKKRVHPALWNKLRSKSKVTGPLLSIVVPVYNVEKYLPACLNSLIRQTYQNIEILVVIDGSPDNSYKIAKSYARWDRRIKVIKKLNGGLGAARNTGITQAKGDFITFVDSDDMLPRDAYQKLMKVITSSGSDFIVGTMQRVDREKKWTPAWAQKVHAVDMIGIKLDDMPDVLLDVFAWNKIFKLNFFKSKVGGFPEKIRYEDILPAAKAYTKANAFDVVSSVSYYWVTRSDGTSISQQKSDIKDISDRLTVIKSVDEYLSKSASEQVYQSWLINTYTHALKAYYEQVPRTDDEYWKVLRQIVSVIYESGTEKILNKVEVNVRFIVWSILKDRKQDVCKIITSISAYGRSFGVEAKDGKVYARPHYINYLKSPLPMPYREIDAQDIKLDAHLIKQYLINTHKLLLEVRATVPVVESSKDDKILVTLSSYTGKEIIVGSFRPEPIYESHAINKRWMNHDLSMYRITIDLRSLPISLSDESWRFSLTLITKEGEFNGGITSRAKNTSASSSLVSSNINGKIYTGEFEHPISRQESGLIAAEYLLRSQDAFAVLKSLDILSSRKFKIVFYCSLGRPSLTKLVSEKEDSVSASSSKIKKISNNIYETTIPIPEQDTASPKWRLVVTDSKGKDFSVLHPSSNYHNNSELIIDEVSNSIYVSSENKSGCYVIHKPDNATYVTNLVASSGKLIIKGYSQLTSMLGDLHFSLVADGVNLVSNKVTKSGLSYTAEFNLIKKENNKDVITVASRSGFLTASVQDHKRNTVVKRVKVTRKLESLMPIQAHEENAYNLFITRTPKASTLWIKLAPPLKSNELGAHNQFLLQEKYLKKIKEKPESETYFFESYNGSRCDDSPYMISKEILKSNKKAKIYWSVADCSVEVPKKTTRVIRFSKDWYDALASSEFLINNNNFPYFFKKGQGRIYVQTWHGTPLKKIGYHVPSQNLSLPYRELMVREASDWNCLLSQNKYSSKIFREAFGYGGEINESGYPRNDDLSTPFSKKELNDIRSRLGIKPNQKVVLYAPTWRDNVKDLKGKYSLVNYLDIDALRSKIPNYSLLVRGHPNTLNSARSIETDGQVIDVSLYPKINHLFQVADILITDYSSAMFDFAVTGKPILFLTPDLEEYENKTRGFYFNFREKAPGPLISDTDELVKNIRNLEKVKKLYQEKYESFRQEFCIYDDGRASERFLRHIRVHKQ